MKKKIILIMIALLLCVTGCGNDKEKESTYHEITFEQLNQKITNKEDFILLIGSSDCSACAAYKNALDAVISKYNVYVNYLDVKELKDEEKAAVLPYYYQTTPTTVYFNDGIVSDTHNRIVGAASFDDIVADFKTNGYIGK